MNSASSLRQRGGCYLNRVAKAHITRTNHNEKKRETIIELIRRIQQLSHSATIEVGTQLLELPECCSEEQVHAAVAHLLAKQCEDWGQRVEYMLAFDRDNQLVHAAYMPTPSRYFDLHGIHSLAQIIERLEVKSDLRIERYNSRIDTTLRKFVEGMDPQCVEAARSALLATIAALEGASQLMASVEEDGLG